MPKITKDNHEVFKFPVTSKYAGQFRAYTSVGSYPVIYIADEDSVICAECATEFFNREVLEEGNDTFILTDVLYGRCEYCEDCGKKILGC